MRRRWTALLIGLLLLLGTPASAIEIRSAVLASDVVVPQSEISAGGTVVLSTTVTLPRSGRLVVTATWRWRAQDQTAAQGDVVAQVRVDGVLTGPLVIQDTCVGCPWQTSAALIVPFAAASGAHDIALVMGGCCGFYEQPFVVGSGSRLDVLY